ncbi:hypothetical protein [Burkholderia vietnamiensis]|uniref:hypothetical protein n=1 Tax=Burkholderia vietnamiensis TaxID=60552 RepID=UPI001CF5ACAE|nr:hypothetical protein [Burkholderia vietnamiensis]MCA8148122.1 hypothetical protein [Burkholderia vietnamiensis]
MLNALISLDHLLNVLLPFVAAALFVLLTVFTVAKQRRERQRREAAMLAALAQARSTTSDKGVHGYMGVQARITMPF